MDWARLLSLIALVTVVTVCHGEVLDHVYQRSPVAMRESSVSNERISNAVSPMLWRCEIDELGFTDYECDAWAYDEDDDKLYIVHEGACRAVNDDQTLKVSTLDTMICQYGKWTDTSTALDYPKSRQRRSPDIIAAVVIVACIFFCSGEEVVIYVIKKPPTFTTHPPTDTCRPLDLQQEYYAPAGQKSAIVTWTIPAANDEDGTVESIQQVFGNARGGTFEGSSDTWGKQHTIIYEAKDDDGMIDTCYFSFKVKVRTCGALSWPSNGYRECPDGSTQGSTCTYSCHRGYELSGPAQVTCQDGTNPSWSTAPTCQEVSCGSVPSVPDGNVTCVGTTYGSYCRMSCQTGFDLDGQVFTICQYDASWLWLDPTRCIDDIGPDITCKSPQTFYADRGMTSMSVTWEEPTTTDNLDPNPVISKISGPAQGVTMDVGDSQYIAYEATDADDNDSPPCVIEVRVETTSCGHPLNTLSDARLRPNCSMRTYTFGDTCTLTCSMNFPLEGPDVVTCERNNTGSGEPVGYWSWENDTMPHCREIACNELIPPRDGALVADTLNGAPLRQMQCNNETDIPDLGTNFIGLFLCLDSGNWNPNIPKAPDCSATVSNRGYMLPGKFYYYGECNENNTDQILESFGSIVANLHNTMVSICPTSTSCSVGSPTVICGPVSSRRRRHASSRDGFRVDVIPVKKGHTASYSLSDAPHHLEKRQTASHIPIFEFQIVTDFDSSGMTKNEQYDFVDGIQLDGIIPAIKDNARNGDYDHLDYGILSEDEIAFADYGSPYCDPGSVRVRVTKCNLCPRGYYEVDGTCTVCPVGTYSNTSGSTTCTRCPDGYFTRQDTCDSMDNCTKLCEAGSYSPDTFAPCAPCKAGYYQPLTAQTSCVTCPQGKSTKAAGSTASTDCKYFDAYVVDTAGQPIEADIALLNEFTLSFYIKAVSESPDMTISVGQELEVIVKDDIKVVTTSTNDVIGHSSPDIWAHVAVSWDTSLGLLSAFYRNDLAERHSSVFPTSSPSVQNGHLSISAATGTGVAISGLRLQGSVIDQASSASVCQTMGEDDVVGMDMFKHKTPLVVPSVCDVTDECLSSPCGTHGNCMDNVGHYTCTCFGGWSGVNCDTPPDYCINNNCTTGATCISRIEDYTCQCQPGYTGVFCQTPPVDGNWSSWTTWTECTVTCNNGSRERTRTCNSPAPGPYGQNCTGDATETENCNTEPCPECDTLKRPFGVQLQCDTDSVTGMQTCIPVCRPGYVRPPGLAKKNDTYTCGQETDYKWVPKKTIPNCVDPGRTREYVVRAEASYSSTVSSEDEQTVVNTVTSNVAGTACFQSATCNVSVTVNNQVSRRKKRSTGSTVAITFSIPITDTSDLQYDQFVANGTVSSGLQEIIDAINNLESTASVINGSASSFFDVTANGVTYTVDANTLTFDGSASCDAGQVVTDGLCAECPAGSSQFGNDYCSLCDKGKYQDKTGQSSCVQCPYGYTTETIGSDASTDCSVPDNTTTSTTSTIPSTIISTPTSTPNMSTSSLSTTTSDFTSYNTSAGVTTTASSSSSSTAQTTTSVTASTATSAGVTTTSASTSTAPSVSSPISTSTSATSYNTSAGVTTTASSSSSSSSPAAQTTTSATTSTSTSAGVTTTLVSTSTAASVTSPISTSTSATSYNTSAGVTTTASSSSSSPAAHTTTSATTSTSTSAGVTTTASSSSSSAAQTTTSATTSTSTSAGVTTTSVSTSTAASITSSTTGTSTTASTTSRPKKGDTDSQDQTYVYICIAVGAVAVCITIITVAFLCLKNHYTKRARVFDSNVDLQPPHHDVYNHPPPNHPPPVYPLFRGEQGPKNISFTRGASTLTVKDLTIEMESDSKAGGTIDGHNLPAVGPSKSFDNVLYE